MAKKARTPKPPVKAPQRREAPKRGRTDAGGVPMWGWIAGAVAVVALVAGVVVATKSSGSSGGDSSSSVKAAMLAANCTYRDVAPLPPKHDPNNSRGGYHVDVPTLSTPTTGLWSTSPPSGGAHYGEWAIWGFYRQPVNPRQVVHNEEHGAVVIWWGPKVAKSTVDQLEAFYQQQPDGMFGTPYPSLGNKIALTAWTGDPNKYYRNGYYGTGHIAICSGFNQKAFAAFRNAYRGHGPEGIPLSADAPGCGPDTSCS